MDNRKPATKEGGKSAAGEGELTYEIDYSRIQQDEFLQEPKGDSLTHSLPSLPITAQISLLEAYLYLGGAEVRGL